MTFNNLPKQSNSTKSTRRDVIREAMARSEQPKPLGGKPIENADRLTPLQLAGEIVKREKAAVGGMTKLLYRLPPEDQKIVRSVANKYIDQRDLGRHGDPKRVLIEHGIPKDIADKVADALEVDYVATQFQRRRKKDNRDLELPPLTRKDHLAAAHDAHVEDE